MQGDRTPIRAVLFDVDGTLYHSGPVRRSMATQILATFFRAPSRARVRVRNLQCYRKALEAIRREDHVAITQSGGVRNRQRQVALQNGADASTLDADVAEWMGRRPLKSIARARRDGLLELLRDLQFRDVRLGVWSDYPVREKLVALEIADLVDLQLSADDPEIDCLKPWPQGFLRASDLWDIPTAEILYVGDRPDVDATGANAAGMRCAIFSKKPSAGGYWAVRDVAELRDGLLAFLQSG